MYLSTNAQPQEEEKTFIETSRKKGERKGLNVESLLRSNQSETQLTVDRTINYYFHEFLFWSVSFNLKSYFIYYNPQIL